MNIQMLMKQANEMQRKISKAEKELENKKYEKTLGGGAVNVGVNGNFQIEKLEIDQDLLEADNKEMLKEMLMSGLNEMFAEVKKDKDEVLGGLTGGIKFPGAF